MAITRKMKRRKRKTRKYRLKAIAIMKKKNKWPSLKT